MYTRYVSATGLVPRLRGDDVGRVTGDYRPANSFK